MLAAFGAFNENFLINLLEVQFGLGLSYLVNVIWKEAGSVFRIVLNL